MIGISKWVVNGEGYNHLTGFFESFDGGASWPTQGHIPGFEGWTDNSDPVGAFDPWGNFYAVVLPYMFDYTSRGSHRVLSLPVNPRLARSGIGVAVRPHGAVTANATAAVTTANVTGENPGFHQQQAVSRVRRPSRSRRRAHWNVCRRYGRGEKRDEDGEVVLALTGAPPFAPGALAADAVSSVQSRSSNAAPRGI